MSILAKNISKSFGKKKVLDEVTVEVPGGSLVALLGPSGSGKTTLLRIIAGLETPDQGQVLFEGEDATDRSARHRNVGFVFQHYALFKHMNVFDNIASPLRFRKRPADEIGERVGELMKLVQLEGMERKMPWQLSGGQRQRVGLARALSARPKVMLLDEPFGALDAKTRKDLRRWLRKLHDEIHVTSLFVTHDQEEALEVADEVIIFNQGRVEQRGTPDDVYNKPANPFVLEFLGHVNIFHGRMQDGQARLADGSMIGAGQGVGGGGAGGAVRDGAIAAYVRPHEIDLTLAEGNEAPAGRGTPGRVSWIHRAGSTVKVEVQMESGQIVVAELPRERFAALNLEKDQRVYAMPRDGKIFSTDYQI